MAKPPAFPELVNVSDYQRVMRRLEIMRTKRYGWFELWNEISRYLAPDLQHLYVTNNYMDDRGLDITGDILNNTASRALRTLGAGMLSGATSPARPWFGLTTDPDLMESQAVRVWLYEVEKLMRRAFNHSNVYRGLHENYQQMGGYGTGCSGMVEDYNSIVRLQPFPIGEFFVETNAFGIVSTLYREFALYAEQIIAKFGLANVPVRVKEAYQRGDTATRFKIVHAIHTRTEEEMRGGDALNKRYRSVYYVQGDEVNQRPLRDGGFDLFPAIVPRWDVLGSTPYGRSPGTQSIGDIKSLQQDEFSYARVKDYQSNPPVQVPTSARNREMDLLPGGVSYVDELVPHGGIRTAYEVQLNEQALERSIERTERRIESAFYVDLFMMFANQPIRSNVSVPEVNERQQEKMLVLGPVVERLNNETLAPLIEFTFDRMVRGGVLPPPPPEMQNREVRVEFTSVFSQAQKSVTTSAMDRYVFSLGQVAQFKPEVLDNFDADSWNKYYSDALGVTPTVVVPGPRVTMIRRQRAEEQAAQQRAAQMAQMASAEQSMAQAKEINQRANAQQGSPLNNLTGY